MITKKPNAPGWQMTVAQRSSYWRMFGDVTEVMGWGTLPAKERDAKRQELHVRAGLGPISAKAIDRLRGFDAIKSVFMAIIEPDNLEAQMKVQNMPRHRLLTRIKGMAPAAYTQSILEHRFSGRALEDLDESELTQLRNTLEARMHAKQREPVAALDENEPF